MINSGRVSSEICVIGTVPLVTIRVGLRVLKNFSV